MTDGFDAMQAKPAPALWRETMLRENASLRSLLTGRADMWGNDAEKLLAAEVARLGAEADRLRALLHAGVPSPVVRGLLQEWETRHAAAVAYLQDPTRQLPEADYWKHAGGRDTLRRCITELQAVLGPQEQPGTCPHCSRPVRIQVDPSRQLAQRVDAATGTTHVCAGADAASPETSRPGASHGQ